jgi:GNAT superfamily N-acetyltransferase
MVDPTHQGRGLGRTLLDGLVRDQTRAWLSTHVDAPARRLYDAAGWTDIAHIAPSGTPMVIYHRNR